MTTTALIAEYNPFHKGHEYHMQKARRATGADFLIVLMSGNFVQRGEPAVMDKFSRAQAAVLCGADLVLELPVCSACGSAEFFAQGAVSILNALGCVDYLCFGSESADLASLRTIADILSDEPPAYRQALKDALKTGVSFPKARETALRRVLSPDLSSLLARPNDILAVEYLKALKKSQSPIVPIAVLRTGNHYRDTSLEGTFVSAKALRDLLKKTPNADIRAYVPIQTHPVLEQAFSRTYPVFADDFSPAMQYRLLLAQSFREFARCLDVSEDLARRIYRLRYEFTDLSSFAALVSARNYTQTHVMRALFHILLNLPADITYLDGCARILGMRSGAGELLHTIKNNGRLPLISKLADARAVISSYPAFSEAQKNHALTLLDAEQRSSDLYQTAAAARFGTAVRNECSRPFFVLNS